MRPVHFEDQTLIMGAPPGTPPGKCGGLPMRIGQSKIWPGANTFTSYFKPSPEELAALNAGACVELTVHGIVHPPVAVNVDYPKVVTEEVKP